MIFVACSGFPVPVSRYWREFPAVEIAETEIGIPGQGTVRRWLRESPEHFAFSLIAPQSFAAAGFRPSEESEEVLAQLSRLAATLKANAVAFVAPEEFKAGRNNKAAVKAFLASIPEDFPTVVLDFPAWKLKDVLGLGGNRAYTAAYDPTRGETIPPSVLHYLRLPGPAGKRSRYDDGALDQLAAHCEALKAETVMCVFRNVDMHANATTLYKKVKR
ncbi:MAG: DUF72 domain-containing protein [Polyangiales bacterium]